MSRIEEELLKKSKILIAFAAISLFLLPGFAKAQKLGKPLVDSLLAQLRVVKQDTGICEIYGKLSDACMLRDPVAAYSYADKLMALATKVNYKKGLAIAYFCYGSIYTSRPDHAAALENFRKSEQLALEENDLQLLIKIYRSYGWYYASQFDYPHAIENQKRSAEFSIKTNSQVGLSNALNALFLACNSINKNQECITYLNGLLKTTHNNPILNAYITVCMGDVCSQQKNYAAMFKYELAAEALVKSQNNVAVRDYIDFNMGNYYQIYAKDTAKAIEYYQKAADVLHAAHNPQEIRRLTAIGFLYLFQNKYEKALEYFQRGSGLGREYDYDDGIDATFQIGQVYYNQKKNAETFAIQKKAIAEAKRLGNKYLEAYYTGNISYFVTGPQKHQEALKYFKLSANMFHQMKFYTLEAYHLSDMALEQVALKDYNGALTNLKKELELSALYKDKGTMADVNNYTARIYRQTHNYPEAIKYQLKAEQYYPASSIKDFAFADLFVSQVYDQMHDSENSLKYAEKVLAETKAITVEATSKFYEVRALGFIANAEYKLKRYGPAMDHVQQSMAKGRGIANSTANEGNAYSILGLIVRDAPDNILKKYGIDPSKRFTEALADITKGYKLNKSNEMSLEDQTDYWHDLSITYEKLKQFDKAYDAYKSYVMFKDSADVESDQANFTQDVAQFEYKHNEDSIKYQQALTGERLKQQTTELNSKRAQSRFFVGGIIVLFLLCFFAGLNYVNQRRANRIILLANEEAAAQKAVAEKSLAELKAAQGQLVQSEKMASLGELTAGIAHEIQNPLNFVNNFSEVNREMIDELEEELKSGNLADALEIAASIKQNEEKINHHGKRADFIVKGMLQHSRTSTGERQLTSINILADEFFKLSYHGLRAKDKHFNAEIISDFDKSLPLINIVQQDIGRVLLNLFNNAFYAVADKSKAHIEGYEPKVSVTTRPSTAAAGDKGAGILISVHDNGNGIPQKILDKIYQPFFTTKPSGQGTGLGLSLSYDIVKAHGGNITVDTAEGKYTVFNVWLPV